MYRYSKNVLNTDKEFKKVGVYQIYFDDKSKGHCFEEFDKYLNVSLTPFFENTVIKSLVRFQRVHEDCEYFGVLSHAFKFKVGGDKYMKVITPESILKYLNEESEGVDVIAFDRIQKNAKNYFKTANGIHNKLMGNDEDIFEKCLLRLLELLKLPTNIEDGVRFIVYQNKFLTRPNIYEDYVEKLLAPAMEVMNSDKELLRLLWTDSGYKKRLIKRDGFPKRMENDLTRYHRSITGRHRKINFYPMHTFICERLFSYYLTYMNKGLKLEHL